MGADDPKDISFNRDIIHKFDASNLLQFFKKDDLKKQVND